jgi:hypothetical protein
MSVPNAAPAAAPAAPAQQQPQSVDERIRQRAEGFLAQIDEDGPTDALNPNEASEEAPPQEDAETETPEQEAETPALPDVKMVEVELEDGEKVLVPEKVKHRMMADKDYRQKTMELSATRKQVEQHLASAAQLAQQAQQMAPYHAQLFQMENHANYLQQQLQTLGEDPLAFNRVQGELAILLHNKDRFAQGLHQQVAQLNAQQQQLRAKQLEIDAPKLFEEFPELQKPETQQKLAQYVRESGLPQEALDYLNYSPSGTKLAWKAHQYDVMVADQAKARAKLQEKTKTLPAATQSSRAGDPASIKQKQLRSDWQKRGGNINDPAFSAYLRSKLRG